MRLLRDQPRRRAGDLCTVVGAVDPDNESFGRTVFGGHAQDIGQRVSVAERLDNRIAVIEGVAPGAIRAQRECSMAGLNIRLWNEFGCSGCF